MEELLKELEELKQKIAEIEKKIEEKKAKTGRWKPVENDNYWFINIYGQALYDVWNNVFVDRKKYKIGNCYKTEAEANFAIEKLKIIAELKEFEEPKDTAWDGKNVHYYICYNYIIERVDIGWSQLTKQNEIYFESREKTQQAINTIGEDRIKKYYLEVEE